MPADEEMTVGELIGIVETVSVANAEKRVLKGFHSINDQHRRICFQCGRGRTESGVTGLHDYDVASHLSGYEPTTPWYSLRILCDEYAVPL